MPKYRITQDETGYYRTHVKPGWLGVWIPTTLCNSWPNRAMADAHIDAKINGHPVIKIIETE